MRIVSCLLCLGKSFNLHYSKKFHKLASLPIQHLYHNVTKIKVTCINMYISNKNQSSILTYADHSCCQIQILTNKMREK